MTEDNLPLGERISRHPGLRMAKRATGTHPEGSWPSHVWRDWRIRFWLMSTEEGQPAWIDKNTPYFETPFSNHESCPEDGSDITMASVLQSVLDNVRDNEDYPTYDDYAEELQPDQIDSRKAEAKWRAEREVIEEAAQFFRELELHSEGADSYDAWVRHTYGDEYGDLEEFTCPRCGDVLIDGDIFNQHLAEPHSSDPGPVRLPAGADDE